MSSEPSTPPSLRVALIQRVVTHYRLPILERLAGSHGITLRAFHGSSIPGTKIANAKDFRTLDHVELPTTCGHLPTWRGKSVFSFCPSVGRALDEFEPDVILAEGASNLLTNFFVYGHGFPRRIPIVWWTLGLLRGREYRGIAKLYRQLVVAFEHRATALLGYSSLTRDYFARQGYPAEKCFVAINSLETDRIQRDIDAGRDRVDPLRTSLGLSGKRVVLFVGALNAQKKIERLINAFPSIKQRVPEAHLLIVGGGDQKEQLELLAAARNITADATFTGPIYDRISDYYELGDIFVLPGLGGLAISEALTHGLPVICTEGDGTELDYIRDGKSGFVLGEGTDAEMTTRIADCAVDTLRDEPRLREMQAECRRIIREELNIETFLASILRALRYAATAGQTDSDRTHSTAEVNTVR